MGRRLDRTPAPPPDFDLLVLQYQQNLEAALTQLVREVGYTGKFTAILGDGNGTIIVPQAEQGLPRTFYVRKVDQFNNPTDVLEAVQEWDGLSYSNHQGDVWVTCARRPGAPYISIIGPADPWTAYASHGGATPAQYESFKAKIPTLSRVAELRLRPGNGTEIKVSEGAWWVGNTLYYTHEKVLGDLAAYIPATAGKAKYVLVGIDTAGDMQVTDGDEYDIAALPRPAESGVNTKANGVHGLGHVRLVNDISQLAETDVVPRHAIPTVVSSGGGGGVLNNYAATNAPAVDDDDGDGYEVGSSWVDTTTGKVYRCVDASTGAAVWVETTAMDIGCRVYHNANQSIANNTFPIVLAFNSENYDTDAMHDTVTNNSRITIKTAGKYIISAYCTWTSNPTGIRYIAVRLNGTTTIVAGSCPGVISLTQCATEYDLAVNDYLEFAVYQNSGGPLNVLAGTDSPQFWARKVS